MANAKEIWMRFFTACDLPARIGQGYAQNFVEQRIQPYMLKDLTKEEMKELGIHALGDQLAIMRYIKRTDGVNNDLFKSIEHPSSTTSSTSHSHNSAKRDTRASPSIAPRSHVIQKNRTTIPTVLPRIIEAEPVTGLRSDAILQTRLERFKTNSRQPVQEVRVSRPAPQYHEISRPAPQYHEQYIEHERRPTIIRRTQLGKQNRRTFVPRY